MKKVRVIAALAMVLSLMIVPETLAGTWVKQGDNWKYRNDAGKYEASNWIEDNGAWYYIESDGFMKKGWLQEESGNWKYLDYETGALIPDAYKGWDNKTFINRKLDYQITLPDDYHIVTERDATELPGENNSFDFITISSDGKSVVSVIELGIPATWGYELSTSELAEVLKSLYKCEAETSEVTYNDWNLSKLPFSVEDGSVLEYYFGKYEDNIMMIEVIYPEGGWEKAHNILQTLKRPR
jgi:hypothetical protein